MWQSRGLAGRICRHHCRHQRGTLWPQRRFLVLGMFSKLTDHPLPSIVDVSIDFSQLGKRPILSSDGSCEMDWGPKLESVMQCDVRNARAKVNEWLLNGLDRSGPLLFGSSWSIETVGCKELWHPKKIAPAQKAWVESNLASLTVSQAQEASGFRTWYKETPLKTGEKMRERGKRRNI